MHADSPRKKVEGQGFIISIAIVILIAASFAAWATWGPLWGSGPRVELTHTPLAPASTTAPNVVATDGCSSLMARSSEIDDGSIYDKDEYQPPIRTINVSNASPDYQELKKCARRDGNPDITYLNLQFGMTAQEVVRDLKVLNKNQIGGPDGQCCWLLQLDGKIPFDAKFPSNVREMALITRCIAAYCPLDGGTAGQSVADTMSASIQISLGSDAKVLRWTIIEHFNPSVFGTTDRVIRFLRSTELASLGPPDEADSRRANWTFYGDDPDNPTRTVYLDVQRQGPLFEVTMNGNDDEHLYLGIH